MPPSTAITDTLMFFNKSKGAFRMGLLSNSNSWSLDSIGKFSFGVGINAKAVGDFSTSMGNGTVASGAYSTALGAVTKAPGTSSTSMGSGTKAAGTSSVSMGFATEARGEQSLAVGAFSLAGGDQSFAAGLSTDALGTNSASYGDGSRATSTNAFSTGYLTLASGENATSMGDNTVAKSFASLAMGRYNLGLGNSTSWVNTDPILEIGIGTGPATKKNAVTILKNGTVSFKDYTFPNVDGSLNQVLSTNGSGQLTWKNDVGIFKNVGGIVSNSGNNSTDDFVFGSANLPPATSISDTLMFFDKSKGAFRVGGLLSNSNKWSPDSLGNFSFASGVNSLASGIVSTAMGSSSKATGNHSTAIGNSNTASGNYAIAMGYTCLASADNSTSIGRSCNSLGINSTSMGQGTTAYGDYSTTFGSLTDAFGDYSMAMGHRTKAYGINSTSMGYRSIASGNYSTSIGDNTKPRSVSSLALGRYNVGIGDSTSWVVSDPILEVGIGYSDANRKNALTVLKNGDFIVGKETVPPATSLTENILFFDISKAAFRAGNVTNSINWAEAQIGDFSFASGKNTKASGVSSAALGDGTAANALTSVAIGSSTVADGQSSLAGGIGSTASEAAALAFGNIVVASALYSTAFGNQTSAIQASATALGDHTLADGINSTSMGEYTIAHSKSSTALGRYNVGLGNDIAIIATDPILEVGIGTSNIDRRNALTVLKNGNIGVSTYTPDADLHIYHSNSGGSGGLKLQNKSNDEFARFYVSSGDGNLRIYFDTSGLKGTFNDETGVYSTVSDRRLKDNFKALSFDWKAFNQLEPLTYTFKSDKKEKRYIGLVAQDVMDLYPQLVTYTQDEDLYTMDYSGFGVIAIKAVQELKKELLAKDQRILELEARLTKIEKLLDK